MHALLFVTVKSVSRLFIITNPLTLLFAFFFTRFGDHRNGVDLARPQFNFTPYFTDEQELKTKES